MRKEILDLEEDQLLEDRNIEFAHDIRNGPAYKAYHAYIAKKKRKKLKNDEK